MPVVGRLASGVSAPATQVPRWICVRRRSALQKPQRTYWQLQNPVLGKAAASAPEIVPALTNAPLLLLPPCADGAASTAPNDASLMKADRPGAWRPPNS